MLDQIWRDQPISGTAGFVWNATKVVSSAWNKKENRLLAAVTMRAHQITPSQKSFHWCEPMEQSQIWVSWADLPLVYLHQHPLKTSLIIRSLRIYPRVVFFSSPTHQRPKKGCSTHYCLFSARLGDTFINSGLGLRADLGVYVCLIPIIDEPTSRTPINNG